MIKKFIPLFLAVFILSNPVKSLAAEQTFVKLKVPFAVEVPDGRWVDPWKNACEEASMIMVDQYYQGKIKLTNAEAKKLMLPIFTLEDELFGFNKDSNAGETKLFADKFLSFTATIKENPTLDEIKAELTAKRPVITMHYGWGLNNPALHFRSGGSSYHMMVLSGFDDVKKQFIVQDSGNSKGLDFRYKYDIILKTLHDFNRATGQADGPARVLFTEPKTLVKVQNGKRIYLISKTQKQYIAHPDIFKKRGWKWANVKTVTKEQLDALTLGEPIWK